MDRLKDRKEIAGKQLYSLDSDKALASEFLTPEEIKFKKISGQKRKKKVLRKKEKLELEPLPVGTCNLTVKL